MSFNGFPGSGSNAFVHSGFNARGGGVAFYLSIVGGILRKYGAAGNLIWTSTAGLGSVDAVPETGVIFTCDAASGASPRVRRFNSDGIETWNATPTGWVNGSLFDVQSLSSGQGVVVGHHAIDTIDYVVATRFLDDGTQDWTYPYGTNVSAMRFGARDDDDNVYGALESIAATTRLRKLSEAGGGVMWAATIRPSPRFNHRSTGQLWVLEYHPSSEMQVHHIDQSDGSIIDTFIFNFGRFVWCFTLDDDGFIYLGLTGSGGNDNVVKYDISGGSPSMVWGVRVSGTLTAPAARGIDYDPINHRLIVAADRQTTGPFGSLYCLDATDGTLQWSADAGVPGAAPYKHVRVVFA